MDATISLSNLRITSSDFHEMAGIHLEAQTASNSRNIAVHDSHIYQHLLFTYLISPINWSAQLAKVFYSSRTFHLLISYIPYTHLVHVFSSAMHYWQNEKRPFVINNVFGASQPIKASSANEVGSNNSNGR